MEDRWVTVPTASLARGEQDHEVHTAHWGGVAEGGRTIVCVHGLGGSHLNWSLVGPGLAEIGGVREVWAPDLAGFGFTEPGERSAKLGDNLDLLSGFVDTVSGGQPVVLLGNSMGGLLAMKMGSRHPDQVAGLVLVDPAAPPRILGPLDPQVLARFTTMAVPVLGERWMTRAWGRTTPEEQVTETFRLVAAAPDTLDPDVLERHVEIAARRREMPHAIAASLTAARSLLRNLTFGRKRYWADVTAVRPPTLLVHGAADRLVQDQATQALRERRPDWAFRSYPDLGHVPMLEDPLRFLGDVSAWLEEQELVEPAA